MATKKPANGWAATNIREHHLRRDGKIVGKLMRYWEDGYPDRQLSPWYCYPYVKGRPKFIQFRRDVEKAKVVVEQFLARQATRAKGRAR